MRPIKWKGIRSGLTICCQKISQTNLQCYSCMMKLKIINFGLFFKMRSRDDFPLDSSWFVCLWPTQKCRKNRSDIILVTNPLSESSDLLLSYQDVCAERVLYHDGGDGDHHDPILVRIFRFQRSRFPLFTRRLQRDARFGSARHRKKVNDEGTKFHSLERDMRRKEMTNDIHFFP